MKLSKVYLTLFLTVPVFANATEKNITELEQITVNATRDPSVYAQTSNNINKLENNKLRQQQPTGVADALKNLVNVDIQGGSRAIAQKPSIRGLSGNRVAQVIDGVKQNFDLAHRGSYFLPPSLIQEIEVVKGPSSTLWGSGALGGVVAIKTPNALDLLKSGEKWGIKVRQGYQSANSLSESEVSVYAANDKFDALISGYYNDADKLRLGSGEDLPHSAYSQKGGLIKLGWQINDEQRLELSHRLSINKQTAPSNNENRDGITTLDDFVAIGNKILNSPTRNYNAIGGIAYLVRQKNTSDSISLNYYLNPENNPYLNSQFTLYRGVTRNKETRFSGAQDQTKFTTVGINLKNSSEINGISLTYGVDISQDNIKLIRGTNNSDAEFRPDSYDAKSQVIGTYLLSHIPVLEKFIISPSLRYDHFKNKGKNQSQSKSSFSPSLSVQWKITNWLDLTTRYTQAFRAPSLQEQYASGYHFGGTFCIDTKCMQKIPISNEIIPNPNLKSEKARNKEISAYFHFDNTLMTSDKLTFNATYFQNDIRNFIDFHVGTKDRSLISYYYNIPKISIKGFELETKYQTDRLNLVLGYGQTRGKDRDTQQSLSNIAADKLTFAINYALVKDKFTVGSRISHYFTQNRVPKNRAMTYDGYTLTDIYATYAPTSGEWSHLRIDFAIENLFDKQYQPAFSLMEGSGRNVKLSLGYRF